jgi:hypothetical protein
MRTRRLWIVAAALALAALACGRLPGVAPTLAQPSTPVVYPKTSYYGVTCLPTEVQSLTVTINMNMHYQQVNFEWSYAPLPFTSFSGPFDYRSMMTEINPGEYSVTIVHDFDAVNAALNGGSGVIVYEITGTVPNGMMGISASEPSIEPCSPPEDQK